MPKFNYQGNHLFYRRQGEGPLLVILPGNTASSICHQADLDFFAPSFTTSHWIFWGRVNRIELTTCHPIGTAIVPIRQPP